MVSPPLRGILFDLDDTLADSSGSEERIWEAVADVIAEHVPAVDRAELRRRYLDVLEGHYSELTAGRVDFHTFRRRRLADALSPWASVDDELFARYTDVKLRVIEELVPFPDAVATLRGLRALGLRLGVLTNGPSFLQRRKLEVSALGPELDAIAISGEIGAAKPDGAAFAAALALLGTAADETAMVGDSLENDVLGGLRAGLAAVVWMPGTREGELPPGAHLAREIAEVPRLLGLPAK
ncbi:MAG: HAD-IA family hydrolase [Elusimicrobia bacterium]|nr:HAD-IA family hydrolase [Elusimicrobiota bacterium]